MSKTSILAETLAEIREIKEGIEKNANHILKNTLKEDLEALVRKGLNEAEEDIQSDDIVGDGNPTDQDSEIVNPEEMPSVEPEMDPTMEPEMDSTMEPEMGGAEVIDLTDEPFDKVVDTFERMQLTDEIEIVKTPEGGIQINIEPEGATPDMGGEETPIEEPEMGGDETEDDLSLDMGGEETPIEEPEMGGDETEDDDETIKEENEAVYEIEITEDEHTAEHEEPVAHVGAKTGMSGDAASGHDHEVNENEEVEEGRAKAKDSMRNEVEEGRAKAKDSMRHNTEELHESLVATRKKLQALVSENKNKTQELENVTALVEEFKGAEKEYKAAIKNLKGQLQEVALFTSNLTYAVKLMTENSTTKDEKLDILKRFDSAKTLTESREVFNSLESLFKSSKTTVEKTIEERVLETPKASGAANLNESTAYKNPQLERMLDIIGKIK